MVTMNISLPDDMKAFVDEEVRARGFMSSSEYVRDLIRQQREVADLRAKLDQAQPVPISAFDSAYFAQLRARVDLKR
jgi:antitoxin ParD1/3/4